MTAQIDSWGLRWYTHVQAGAGSLVVVTSVLLIALADGPHWANWITLVSGLGMVYLAGYEYLQARRRAQTARRQSGGAVGPSTYRDA